LKKTFLKKIISEKFFFIPQKTVFLHHEYYQQQQFPVAENNKHYRNLTDYKSVNIAD